jgi:6-phosphogluconolactonase (cycloisomerase 2 family)
MNWKGSSGGGTQDSGPKPPDPRLLAALNEESDTVAVFERDETTGRLAESGKTFPQARPQCLVFA